MGGTCPTKNYLRRGLSQGRATDLSHGREEKRPTHVSGGQRGEGGGEEKNREQLSRRAKKLDIKV